jgi:hypothetical protein
MSRYLVEVHHGAEKKECLNAISVFENSGSHFLTHADWGCLDGEHKAWFLLEVESKDDALRIVPPAFRKDTKVIQLSKFNFRDAKTLFGPHNL